MWKLVIFSALILITTVNSATILSVNLVSLYNQNSEVYTQTNRILCCNNAARVSHRRVDHCNAVLQVCYRPTNHDRCQQIHTSTLIPKQRSIQFTTTIGNLSNPINFQVDHWTLFSGFTVKAFEDAGQTRTIGVFDVFPYQSKVDTSINTARVHEKRSAQDHKTHAILHVTFKIYHKQLCSPDHVHNMECDSNGKLVCSPNFYGPHCDKKCEPTPNGHCDSSGVLVCNSSYYGQRCEKHCIPPPSHGHCDANGTLRCDPSYYGLNCDKHCVPPPSHGHCDANGTLRCDPSYYALNCDKHCVPPPSHGHCDANGTLICDPSYYGPNCDKHCIPPPSHGHCDANGTLICDQYFYGLLCDKHCVPPPSNGHCDANGFLRCDPPFTGSNCNESSATSLSQAAADFTLRITLQTLYIPDCPCTKPSNTCLPVCHPATQICFRESSRNICTKIIKGTTDYSGIHHTTFGSTVGNLTNPILLHFPMWSPRYRFQVLFYGNGQASHLIGSFLVTPFMTDTSVTTEGQNIKHVTKTYYNTGAILTLDYEVFRSLCTAQPEQHRVCNQDGRLVCETNHYGPNCDRICVPTHHGTCNNLGHLSCDQNYYGPICDVQCVPTGQKTCDNNGNLRCHPNFYGTQCDIHCVSTNHGRCDPHGKLRCVNNYYGPNCTVHCVATGNKNCSNTGRSVCKDFFYGINCESRCGTIVITHFERNNEGTLICKKEYYGPCCNQVCQHLQHGHCNSTHIVCDPEYFGSTCATHCVSTDHGHCSVNGTLLCDQNFYGLSCNVSCIPTGHKVCDKNGTFHCDRDYYGPSCDVYCSVPNGHGTCDSTGQPQCGQEYYGPSCNKSCPVQSNGQRRCNVSELVCTSQPCLNHGTCKENVNTYECQCLFEYTGKNCEILNLCAYSPCRHGHCTTTSSGFQCSCEPGWTGFTCETDINECLKSVCQTGQTCINNFGSYTCLSCEHTVCQNNGTCIYQDSAPVCKCEPGWTGTDCSVTDTCLVNPCGHYKRCEAFTDGYYCHYVDDVCSLMPCKNGGVCQQNGHIFTCQCSLGFKGEFCDEIDHCISQPCLNGGTCTYNSTSYTCTCATGLIGDTCNKVDHCSSGPCNNNSACVNGNLSYTCVCSEGWQGHDCMTKDVCFNSLCNDGSTCLASNSSFTCKCPPGKTGPLCNITMTSCDPSPCLNHAICEIEGQAAVCYCLGGWVGEICDNDVNECERNPCPKPLACVNLPGGFTCEDQQQEVRRYLRRQPIRSRLIQPTQTEGGSLVSISSVLTKENIVNITQHVKDILTQRVCPTQPVSVQLFGFHSDVSFGNSTINIRIFCGDDVIDRKTVEKELLDFL